MVDESGPVWDASQIIGRCPRRSWHGAVWRCLGRHYAGDNADGSLKVSGRFHRGRDAFPAEACWKALYTSVGQHIALAERIRHTSATSLRRLANQRMSRLRVHLREVVVLCAPGGCADSGAPGLTLADVCRPMDYQCPQELARAARSIAEAMLVPSCTGFPEGNLIIFPDRLRSGSVVSIEESLDPNLYIDWDSVSQPPAP